MGYKELIDSLLEESENKIIALHQETEAETMRIKSEVLNKTKQIKNNYNKQYLLMVKELSEGILSEARKKATIIRLSAEKDLSDRLYSLAFTLLQNLRNKNYEKVFEVLISELPPLQWQTVRVNPEDKEIAIKYFPRSEIITDRKISGGLIVITDDGKIHVDNTYEKRLERAWTIILPMIMKDILV